MLACHDCGVPYKELGCDIALPDQQWRVLFPERRGVLCANCICQRARRLGGTVLLAWIENLNYDTAAEEGGK